MHEMHERPGLESPRSWRTRAIVLAVLTISYGALFYGLQHMPEPQSSFVDSRQMFTPIVSKIGEERLGSTRSKPRRPEEQGLRGEYEQSLPPPRHWTFPPIDLSPSAPGWVATSSEFTPITDAKPDPSEMQALLPAGQPVPKSVPRNWNLQMVYWFRPVYDHAQCSSRPADGPLVLDLLINSDGRPVGTTIAQSSGASQLDNTVLRAANLWRFAPPLWKSRPVEVWGRIEVRFNC